MKSSIKIRYANIEDINQILKLWKELMDFHQPMDKYFEMNPEAMDHFKPHLEKCITSDEKIVLVALDTQTYTIVGYLIGEINLYPPVYKIKLRGSIGSIVVTEKYRNMNIGTKLVEHAKKWYNNQGIVRIHAHIAKSNSISLSFWKNMGFKPIFEEMYYEI